MPDATDALSAADIIRELGLRPHPEGGHFRETFRDPAAVASDGEERGASTAIYYLLKTGEVSHWHRVDAAEVWHWYAGAPLVLTLSVDGQQSASHTLGTDLLMGQRPQLVVPAQAWQTARSLGVWSLVGCTVAPAFRFEGYEMAPPDWRPHPRFARREER
jgi:predicted cupin superfamily sugar epimerase